MRLLFLKKLQRWADCKIGMRWQANNGQISIVQASDRKWLDRIRSPAMFARALRVMVTQCRKEFQTRPTGHRAEWIQALASLRQAIHTRVMDCRTAWGRLYCFAGGVDVDKNYQTIMQLLHRELAQLSREDVEEVNRWITHERRHQMDAILTSWDKEWTELRDKLQACMGQWEDQDLHVELMDRIRRNYDDEQRQALIAEMESWMQATLKSGADIALLLSEEQERSLHDAQEWELLGRLDTWASLVRAERNAISMRVQSWTLTRRRESRELKEITDQLAASRAGTVESEQLQVMGQLLAQRELADQQLVQELTDNFLQMADQLQVVIRHLDQVLMNDANLNDRLAAS